MFGGSEFSRLKVPQSPLFVVCSCRHTIYVGILDYRLYVDILDTESVIIFARGTHFKYNIFNLGPTLSRFI